MMVWRAGRRDRGPRGVIIGVDGGDVRSMRSGDARSMTSGVGLAGVVIILTSGDECDRVGCALHGTIVPVGTAWVSRSYFIVG